MLRSLLIIFIGAIFTILCSIVAIVIGIFGPYSKAANGLVRFWAKSLLSLSGIKLEIIGQDKIFEQPPSVYIANHQSLFDILAAIISIPGTARFIAKKELFRIPVFAQGLKLIGTIKIDRGNSAKARETINESIKIIKRGVSVIIFPEGTRSKDGKIKPFKKGGFVLATQGKIPIVPMVISGSLYIMAKQNLRVRKGKIKVEFLDPIATDNMSYEDRNMLMENVRQKIITHYDEKYNQE